MASVALRASRFFSYPTASESSALACTLRVGEADPTGASKPRLLDRVRAAIRARHYSRRTDKDCVTMLPAAVKPHLARHLEGVREQHRCDLVAGAGWVELPTALARKYPNAGREWVWQWVFPATRMRRAPIRLITLASVLLLAAPLAAAAQQPGKTPRIAFITTTSPGPSPTTDAFREGRWGRGTTQRFAEFAADVVGLKVDLIGAANNAAGHAAHS
jgi:hypothetical protein